jgi:hypothetical protein
MGAASVWAEFSLLERALNYPKSRPAGGGFATLAGAMFGRFREYVSWAEHFGDGGVAQLVRAAES